LLLCLLLSLCLVLPFPAAFADGVAQPMVENLSLSVDGAEGRTVRALHYSYQNNRYVSLRDMAAALIGTPRRFALHVSRDQISITTGTDYTPVGGENEPFPDASYSTGYLALNPLELDGRPLRYLSFLGTNAAGQLDCFMRLTDLAMQLDLSLRVSAGSMALDSAAGYHIDLDTLEEEGFYYEIHSALVGDATTGLVYTAWEPLLSVPIASTTKLMSFIVIMDAARDGEIRLDDTVTIPEEAVRLSRTPDGTVYMETGWETTVPELLYGMLLPSSNECALALAIHVAGSEDAFVARMNRKARALNLSDSAVFYNCHGLPVYTDNLAATKVQNRMSANDMFKLVCYLLRTYPDVTRITSRKSAELPSLHTSVANTNSLLYNLPGVVGLKTGTTNRSGSCLVAAMEVTDSEGNAHTLVSIEYGAEDSATRTTLSEELLRYGLQCLRENPALAEAPPRMIPADAEALIRMVLESY
jgi:D-alanyl-D-alanine carboxypeptidase